MSTETPSPDTVFTPRSPPSREMFTRRTEPDAIGVGLQDLVREALREPGSQLLIYGDAGVGKTTLLQYAAEDEGIGLVRAQCTGSRSFEQHIDAAIREVVERREVSLLSGQSRDRGGEAGISTFVTLRGRIGQRQEETRQFETISQEPIRELARVLADDRRRLIVFDNFQNVDRDQVRFFAQAAEVLSDLSDQTGDVKMAIVGIAEDAHEIVGDSSSLRRRITEIEVPRMSDSEIDEILTNGFRLLDLSVSADAVARLIFFCDGFPYFAHMLGLHVARNALRAAIRDVDRERVDAALERTARSVEASFDERILKAFERSGATQPRRRVLELLAASHTRAWTGAEIIAACRSSTRARSPSDDQLRTALGQLTKTEYGEVLQRTGAPRRYRYRFADPFLRPYLRMRSATSPVHEPPGIGDELLGARESRRTVTVVFCEIVGSTQLGERVDPEEFVRILDRYLTTVQRVFQRHGGTLEKLIGDSIMAIFGVPVAREDDVLRALRAADEVQQAIDWLNESRATDSPALQMRIGVNTGEVLAGEGAAGLVAGDVVVMASRLGSAAHPGKILIGADTYAFAHDLVDVDPVPPLTVQGRSGVVAAYRLVSVRDLSSAALRRSSELPIVGRHAELAALRAILDDAVTASECRLAVLIGPAGVGKSHLAEELIQLSPEARAVRGRCLSYGDGITYWPLIDIACEAAGVPTQERDRNLDAALTRLLAGTVDGDRIANTLSALAQGVGVGKQVVFWAARRLLEELAHDRPLIAVIEDVHWAEAVFVELIEHVLDHSRSVPILLCCLSRDEILLGQTHQTAPPARAQRIVLSELGFDETRLLISRLVGDGIDETVIQQLAERTGGNPLFAEVLTQSLIDQGVLVRQGEQWQLTLDEPFRLPPTIASLLSARIDGLRPAERLVVERAAVIGTVFETGAVAALVPTELRNSVGESLDALIDAEVIDATPSDEGRSTFRFRHTLLRDTAYARISRRERAELHEQLAHWLQQRPAGSSEREEISYHRAQADQLRRELSTLDIPPER